MVDRACLYYKLKAEVSKAYDTRYTVGVPLQCQTETAKVDLAFVQTQPLPLHLTVAVELLFIQSSRVITIIFTTETSTSD